MKHEQSGDVGKSETPEGGVGTQMPRPGSIPGVLLHWHLVDVLIASLISEAIDTARAKFEEGK